MDHPAGHRYEVPALFCGHSVGAGEDGHPARDIGVSEGRGPVFRCVQRSPPVQSIGDVVEPGRRPGQVEIDEGNGQSVPEHDVPGAVVTVTHQLRIAVDGRRRTPGRTVERPIRRPAEASRPCEASCRQADEPRQRGEYVLACGPGGNGSRGTSPGNEGQYLAALVINAQRDRRAGKAGAVQMGQISLDRRRKRPDRPPAPRASRSAIEPILPPPSRPVPADRKPQTADRGRLPSSSAPSADEFPPARR